MLYCEEVAHNQDNLTHGTSGHLDHEPWAKFISLPSGLSLMTSSLSDSFRLPAKHQIPTKSAHCDSNHDIPIIRHEDQPILHQSLSHSSSHIVQLEGLGSTHIIINAHTVCKAYKPALTTCSLPPA